MTIRKENWQRQLVVLEVKDPLDTGAKKLVLEGQLLKPNTASDTVFMIMHPTTPMQYLPFPVGLAENGYHVLCGNGRYARNDSQGIMEKCCYDLGRFIKWAKEEGGYKKVILVGWSGGGGLALFYQSQAENPTVTHTSAGDPYDLSKAGLQPADGLIFIAAHLSRAETLTEMLDPSVKDEQNPDDRDLELDVYDPRCPNKAPFSQEFIKRFREAQDARSRRITEWAEASIKRLATLNPPEIDRSFIVYRTWCDLRFLDPTIDPNGRPEDTTMLGRGDLANVAPTGLSRYTSLRSWLSQWSIDRSQAKGTTAAEHIHAIPVLVIQNGSDDGVPATHSPTIFNHLAAKRKEMQIVEGANHYYIGQPNELKEAIGYITEWGERQNLLQPAK